MIKLVVTLTLLGAPEELDENRIDFFEKFRPLERLRIRRDRTV